MEEEIARFFVPKQDRLKLKVLIDESTSQSSLLELKYIMLGESNRINEHGWLVLIMQSSSGSSRSQVVLIVLIPTMSFDLLLIECR